MATGGRAGVGGHSSHPGAVFTGPDVPPDYGHPPQIWAVMNRAASEARELNHPWIGDDHLVLGILHPDCPGAARRVLESFGIRPEPFRQAFIASMGDPWDPKPTHTTLSPATQLVLERANLPGPWAHALDLAPNPLGHDPRRRGPWGSRGFGVPLDRPPRKGMLGRQYFQQAAPWWEAATMIRSSYSPKR